MCAMAFRRVNLRGASGHCTPEAIEIDCFADVVGSLTQPPAKRHWYWVNFVGATETLAPPVADVVLVASFDHGSDFDARRYTVTDWRAIGVTAPRSTSFVTMCTTDPRGIVRDGPIVNAEASMCAKVISPSAPVESGLGPPGGNPLVERAPETPPPTRIDRF